MDGDLFFNIGFSPYLLPVLLPLLYYFACFMNYGCFFLIIYAVYAVWFVLYEFWFTFV